MSSNVVRRKLSDLHDQALNRPPGYLEQFMSAGTIPPDAPTMIEYDVETWNKLVAQWRPHDKNPGLLQQGCCGQ